MAKYTIDDQQTGLINKIIENPTMISTENLQMQLFYLHNKKKIKMVMMTKKQLINLG